MSCPSRTATRLLTTALALVTAEAVEADLLRLKDGRTLEGPVTDRGNAVDIQTPQGTVTVQKENVQEWKKDPAPAAPKAGGTEGKDPGQEAVALVEAAGKAIERKSYAEAKRILERVVKQHADTAAADKARETLATMPTALGRLVLGLERPTEARAVWTSKLGKVQEGGRVQVEHITDDKRIRQGLGAARIVIDGNTGATLVKFAIPEQSLEKLRMVSFWMWSEAKLHQKRTMKLVLFSPGTQEAPNFFDANIVGADANGWKLVQVQRGQFKGEGGGFAADFQNGRPDWKKIDGIGFLLPVENYRDFILDDVRILD